MVTQTKRVPVFRGKHKIHILEPGTVAGFLDSTESEQVYRVFRSEGQVFKILLAEKHYRSTASETTFSFRTGTGKEFQHAKRCHRWIDPA
jgi:hypothetical protein